MMMTMTMMMSQKVWHHAFRLTLTDVQTSPDVQCSPRSRRLQPPLPSLSFQVEVSRY